MPTAATFRRYEYRRRLPHYQRDDRPLFVTFRSMIPLSPEARTLALQHCLHDDGKTIRLHAAVIMPDHVHLLFTALRDREGWTFALPEILRAIKGCCARSINLLEEVAHYGRMSLSTTFFAAMRACRRPLTISARIRFTRDWLAVPNNTGGYGLRRICLKLVCSWLDFAGRSARATDYSSSFSPICIVRYRS